MTVVNASCDVGTILMGHNAGKDGFPSKIYTLLACGKPPIVWAEEGSPLQTIIRDSECGRFVVSGDSQTYADAVLKAYLERDLLESEGERGRRFVAEHHSRENLARKCDGLIGKLLS